MFSSAADYAGEKGMQGHGLQIRASVMCSRRKLQRIKLKQPKVSQKYYKYCQ